MNFFQMESKFQEYLLSECQTILIQIRPNNMLCLIRVQIACKGYQLAMKDLGSEVTVAIGFDVVSIDVGIRKALASESVIFS